MARAKDDGDDNNNNRNNKGNPCHRAPFPSQFLDLAAPNYETTTHNTEALNFWLVRISWGSCCSMYVTREVPLH